ncbi:AAA family ATPase [Duganella aceris]|uniref:AAA family ATPase n=1 Tax=Duganella aceris TaxID=2703883 RepID=A0ABX0FD67_9BURK|nr:ATP-binding protein [Duganella aceris]NGZ82889.1 AAA family ATPase [Duganella aceris]
MQIKHLKLRNWRNFHLVDVDLGARVILIGPNASGKSNFLDVFRFLRDIAGEGLQKAVRVNRGGIGVLRCLSARQYSNIDIEIAIDDESDQWNYRLVINQDNNSRPMVKEEVVSRNGIVVEKRPNKEDGLDPERLFYTSLEQVVANHQFRKLSEFFRSVSYQNLLPQVVRDPKGFTANPVADDPFGRDFLMRMWRTQERTRDSRLKKIGQALRVAVPQLTKLEVAMDDVGSPHLVVGYEHWRRVDAKQYERDLSDGTLRLLGLLWSLFEGEGPLLLEEPEISLHSEVVSRLPQMIERINRSRRIKRQVFISTHSEDLLGDKGIAADEVLRLEPGKDGTKVLAADATEREMVKHGLSVAEVILPKSAPKDIAQLALAF